MTLNDRVARGFIAGLAGAAVEESLLCALFALRWTEVKYADFVSRLIYGPADTALASHLFAEAVLWVWLGGLGALFALLVPALTSRNYRWKGAGYGIFIWFFSLGASTVLRVSGLQQFGLGTAMSTAVAGIVWGLVTAEALRCVAHSCAASPSRQQR